MSLLFVYKFKNILLKWRQKSKIVSLALIGTIHGITNSGGTMLSIIVSALNKHQINQSRYNITFSYLFLALFQYTVFIFIFDKKIFILNFIDVLIMVLSGFIIGNLIIKIINENIFKLLINILALTSAIFLILKA